MAIVSPGFATARRHRFKASWQPQVVTISSGESVQPDSMARRAICVRRLRLPGGMSQLLHWMAWRRATDAIVRCNWSVGNNCGLGMAAPKPTSAGAWVALSTSITRSFTLTRVAFGVGSDLLGSGGGDQSLART